MCAKDFRYVGCIYTLYGRASLQHGSGLTYVRLIVRTLLATI